MKKLSMLGLAAGTLLLAQPVASAAPRADAAAAVANTAARSPDNVKLDEGRKPAELLRFFGLQRGMAVGDLFGINLYWSEIMAPAVGPRGSVTIWEPTQFVNAERSAAFEAFRAKQPNVTMIQSPFEAPNLPRGKFDFVLINLDYHDVYWMNEQRHIVRMDPAVLTRAIYASLKPGGVLGLVDHAGPAGDTRAIVDKLHRIDPAVVRRDFTRAGFRLEASSSLLRNPADDHSLLVFDPKIRGHTDRFVYKFRKPR
ncbi:methyltransferase [Sphingomonas ginkgonis]|uniref:Methyltransferase n=1 Tax=Sphingomonas ginkgonis TaxID=2315330 RepID=A0A429VAD1_9SPHN|nr:class I SAM-dependent methyltransferase [Sphingomonas ginkgonis]RST30904.1 methyltransferase [Sphingomonas ginkgonis]